jgi:hypothetical protein
LQLLANVGTMYLSLCYQNKSMGKELLISELEKILPDSVVNTLYTDKPAAEFQAALNWYLGKKYVPKSFWAILRAKLIGAKYAKNSPAINEIAKWLHENRIAAQTHGRQWPPVIYH